MQIRSDRGWIKAGLAVLVTGVLGGGVLAAAGGSRPPRKVAAEGVTGPEAAAPVDKPFDLGGVAPAGADEAPPEEDPVVGDKVVMGDGSVTVSAVEDNVSAGRLFGAGQGFKYIAAEVKGCAGPNEKNITFEPAYFLLKLDDGTIRDPGPGAKKPSLEGGKVPPGKCLSGWVTFVVPDGALATGVLYDGSVRTTWMVPLPKNAKPTTTTTMKPGAATASSTSSTTATTAKPKSASSSGSSTTTTTASKAKASSTTTSTSKPKAAGSSAGSTTTTTGKTATTGTATTGTTGTTATTGPNGSTTSTTKPANGPSTTKPASSSSTATTAKQG